MSYTYEYARPAVTVDCVVFGLDDEGLKVLLIQRGIAPFEGYWALPGGFVQMEESLTDAAKRELEEETGVSRVYLEQLYTFGDLKRDPRGRVISVAYYALVRLSDHRVRSATDARDAGWFSVWDVPDMAFDHHDVFETAFDRLRSKLRYRPIGFELLPRKFTISQLQNVYEIVLDRQLDRRNFRKKVLATGVLTALKEVQQDVAHRAARFYSFNRKAYKRLERDGFGFEIP